MPDFDRVLGVDPGPAGFAWALWEPDCADITCWRHVPLDWDGEAWEHERAVAHRTPDTLIREGMLIAIEDVSAGGCGNPVDRHVFVTAGMVGLLRQLLGARYQCPTVAIHRVTAKCALPTCNSRSTEAYVNRVMRSLCPSLNRRKKGLDGHVRAAALIAYVGAGQYQRQQIERQGRE